MKSTTVDPRQIEALMKSRSPFVRLVKRKVCFRACLGNPFPPLAQERRAREALQTTRRLKRVSSPSRPDPRGAIFTISVVSQFRRAPPRG